MVDTPQGFTFNLLSDEREVSITRSLGVSNEFLTTIDSLDLGFDGGNGLADVFEALSLDDGAGGSGTANGLNNRLGILGLEDGTSQTAEQGLFDAFGTDTDAEQDGGFSAFQDIVNQRAAERGSVGDSPGFVSLGQLNQQFDPFEDIFGSEGSGSDDGATDFGSFPGSANPSIAPEDRPVNLFPELSPSSDNSPVFFDVPPPSDTPDTGDGPPIDIRTGQPGKVFGSDFTPVPPPSGEPDNGDGPPIDIRTGQPGTPQPPVETTPVPPPSDDPDNGDGPPIDIRTGEPGKPFETTPVPPPSDETDGDDDPEAPPSDDSAGADIPDPTGGVNPGGNGDISPLFQQGARNPDVSTPVEFDFGVGGFTDDDASILFARNANTSTPVSFDIDTGGLTGAGLTVFFSQGVRNPATTTPLPFETETGSSGGDPAVIDVDLGDRFGDLGGFGDFDGLV